MHSQSFRGYHNASLLRSPQVSLTVAAFLGAPRRGQSSACRGRTWLGPGPGASPDPVAIPGELVHPSNESSLGSAVQRIGTPVWKRTQSTVRWHTSPFVSGFLCCSLVEPPVRLLNRPAWLESRWGLQKCCRNQYSRNQAPYVESWRIQVFYTGRPRGVNTLSSEPWTRGYRVFIHGQAWLSRFVGAWWLQRGGQEWVK